MRYKKAAKQAGALLALVFLSVLLLGNAGQKVQEQTYRKMELSDEWYRCFFFSEAMQEKEQYLSETCKKFLAGVEEDVRYFPVPISVEQPSLTVSYVDTWQAERNYKGKRGHEGTDLMASENRRGLYPVVSMTDGTVTNIGWLEKGGYRVGVTSENGVYYYYAHLESYSGIKKGDTVKAGELLGYMGDSGYGPEGTVGKFAVHLHLGIYSYQDGKEISVNPYHLLRSLENKKLKYAYS